MFSRLSCTGIIAENFRSLTFSLLFAYMVVSLLGLESAVIYLGTALGAYYGYRIEGQINEIRTLGGRIMKCASWDYLILA
jgi:hypothetical protein